MTMRTSIPVLLLLASTAGCSFIARGPKRYRDDTVAAIDQAKAAMKSCYDGILKSKKEVRGTVTVTFVVQKETGKIADAKVNQKKTEAPQELADCITNSLAEVTLKPADARDGHATFSFEFQVTPARSSGPSSFDASGKK